MREYRVEFQNCIVFADSEEEAVTKAMLEVKTSFGSAEFIFQVNEVN